jgi:diguanylate cyclase (GGDEF)-like protein
VAATRRGTNAGIGVAALGGFTSIAVARGLAAAALGVYLFTYRALPEHPPPGHAQPLAFALIAGLTISAILQLLPRFRSSHSASAGFLAMDALAAVLLAWLFGFDPRRHTFMPVLLVMLEAAVCFGVRGAIAAWASLSALLVLMEIRTVSLAGVSPGTGPLAIRILSSGVGVVLAGSLMDQLSGERRRRRVERETRVHREMEIKRISDLVHGLKAVVWEADPARELFSFVTRQAEPMVGYPMEDWLTEHGFWVGMLHPEDRQRVLAQTTRAVSEGRDHDLEYRVVVAAGPPIWVRDIVHVHLAEDGRVVRLSGLMVDISRQKSIEEEYSYLAYHDPLTGLPNRAMFERLLDLALARARRANLAVAVLFVDLDDFKTVNDSLGHTSGDDLLRQMGERLRSASRATDVVARQSGDEFLVLLGDLPLPSADGASAREIPLSVSARIHAALAPSFPVAGTNVRVAASIGVSVFPIDATDAASLLVHADQAMYRSKGTGAGRTVVFGEDRVWIPGLTLSVD